MQPVTIPLTPTVKLKDIPNGGLVNIGNIIFERRGNQLVKVADESKTRLRYDELLRACTDYFDIMASPVQSREAYRVIARHLDGEG